MDTYWQIQQPDTPLFPDIDWSRPESKLHAGKLCIIGGSEHGIAAVADAFAAAEKAGIGTVTIVMPDAVGRTIRQFLPEAVFVPSTPSGSFATKSLGDLLAAGVNADAIILAGDIGRNSETAVVLEKYVQKTAQKLIIAQDAADYFVSEPAHIKNRPETLVVVSLAQLQKLFINTPSIMPITYSMSAAQLAEALHNYTQEYQLSITTKHRDTFFVAVSGRVTSTRDTSDRDIWRSTTAARMGVYWLQNPTRPLEAMTSSVIVR
jgi:NAD(P)H-hydrate repair Nnr-like enzyme with NAD(P)H-hydrate dehydratase domain